jgi:hypothetical protein
VCTWKDKETGPVGPALFTANAANHNGDAFSDSFETLDIPGADQAVYTDSFGGDSAVLATVGGHIIRITFVPGTPGGREVAELMATTWVILQGT